MVKRFQKKPVEIEAVQLEDSADAAQDVARWCGGVWGLDTNEVHFIKIETLEGTMEARPGDWVIRGVQGEFYPCKPDIFDATYDAVEDPA